MEFQSNIYIEFWQNDNLIPFGLWKKLLQQPLCANLVMKGVSYANDVICMVYEGFLWETYEQDLLNTNWRARMEVIKHWSQYMYKKTK